MGFWMGKFTTADKPVVALHWKHYMCDARNKFNSENMWQLPPILPHICRYIAVIWLRQEQLQRPYNILWDTRMWQSH